MTFLHSRKRGKDAIKLMNGGTLCDTQMYTACANRHIYLLTLPYSCVHTRDVCASFYLCEGQEGGGVRSVTLSTKRAFILGLSEPTQGEIVGWWSKTGTVADHPLRTQQSSSDFVTISTKPTHINTKKMFFVFLFDCRKRDTKKDLGMNINVQN